MAEVMTLIDGRTETVFSIKDFAELVDKYMGFDAKEYMGDVVSDLIDYEDLQDDYDKLREELEELNGIADDYEKLQDEFAELRRKYMRLEEAYEQYKQNHG